MPETGPHPTEESFYFGVDSKLKAEFQSAAESDNRPLAQVLRDFMRAYVERRRPRTLAADARRQSGLVSARAAHPDSDETAVMRWIEAVSDTDGWTA